MINKEQVIENTAEFVKNKLSGEGSGHDWWHIYRVWQLSKRISQEENADPFIVELSALLHDIADWKFQENNDDSVGAMVTKEWLESQKVDSTTIKHISEIVQNISFKGAGVKDKLASIEGKIVQDADRLDAIGAIGISRCFAYGGYKGTPIYDPEVNPQMHKSFEEYKQKGSSSINHFYEKLLLLKDRMNTKTGKKLANNRHRFMETYLQEFFEEWNGNK